MQQPKFISGDTHTLSAHSTGNPNESHTFAIVLEHLQHALQSNISIDRVNNYMRSIIFAINIKIKPGNKWNHDRYQWF